MNKLIISNNKKAKIVLDDETIFNKLRNHFSYKLKGVEYSAAYQNGWSGITYLIDKKGTFLSGLVPKVKNYLKNKGIKLEEEDLRDPLVIEQECDISARLKELGLVPMEHQKRILEASSISRKGIVRAATGSGKSLATALITAKLNKPTNIYVIGLDLLKQFHDLFSKIFDEPIGFVGDGTCEIHRINIISIWSVASALKIKDIVFDKEDEIKEKSLNDLDKIKLINVLKQTKVHQFDECHVITTNTIKEIFNTIDPEYIYGFSGTPYRDDNSDLLVNGILGEQIINVSASELIEKELLAQPLIKFVSVPPTKVSSDEHYQSIYKQYIVENNLRNELIIKNTKELVDKKYKPLVLFRQISHGKTLLEMLRQSDIKCEMLYGNDNLEKRTKVKKMLEDGEIDVILASSVFDIGVDLPMLSGLILCGGGNSTIKTLQRIGRVIRKYPGKKVSAIVDFYDQCKYLKKHSMRRHEIYSSEDGFKVFPCFEMKQILNKNK